MAPRTRSTRARARQPSLRSMACRRTMANFSDNVMHDRYAFHAGFPVTREATLTGFEPVFPIAFECFATEERRAQAPLSFVGNFIFAGDFGGLAKFSPKN